MCVCVCLHIVFFYTIALGSYMKASIYRYSVLKCVGIMYLATSNPVYTLKLIKKTNTISRIQNKTIYSLYRPNYCVHCFLDLDLKWWHSCRELGFILKGNIYDTHAGKVMRSYLSCRQAVKLPSKQTFDPPSIAKHSL